MKEIITQLAVAMQRKLSALPNRLRLFTTEHSELPNALILTGARGSGKSTFLLYHSNGKRMLYLSADNPKIIGISLYDLVSEIFLLGYEGVIVDEVHFATNWSLHLKAIYDDFPEKLIWVSDSSSLILRIGEYDLSRRYVMMKMPFMSFREFLYLETGKVYPKYDFGADTLPMHPDADILHHFVDYRNYGTRPFYQNGDFEPRYLAVLDKVLNYDIPFFLPNISDNNLRLMRAIVGTLANSSIPRVHVTSLCNDWSIGSDKLYQLLFIMESVELLHIVRLQNDQKAKSIGAKMLFSDPCAYHVLYADKGTERESFVVSCFSQLGYKVEAMRDEKKGDYILSKLGEDSITVEVGGKNKKSKGANFVLRDDVDYPVGNAIPFWLLGMMW